MKRKLEISVRTKDEVIEDLVATLHSTKRQRGARKPCTANPRRMGFLEGEIEVPEDFDTMGGADLFHDELSG